MKKVNRSVLFASILGTLVVIFLLQNNIGVPCIIHSITGLHCPGCGGTRAVLSLLRLDVYQAFRYNALIVLAIPFVIIHLICKYIFKLKYKIPDWLLYILIVVVIIFGVLRNIPYFSFLAPTTIR